MDYTITVDKTFEEAIAGLEDSLKNNNFGALWELNMPEKLAEKGVEYNNKMRIFEVCNPHHAKKALESNIMISYFLPCKIVVYEDNGQIKVGMIKPTTLVSALGDKSLEDFAINVEKELTAIIDGVK